MRFLILCFTLSCLAGDWPQFRGPNASGISAEEVPTTWSKTENIRWKASFPGRSVACPVVAGGKVYISSASGDEKERLHVTCFDAKTGKQVWQRELVATGNTGHHPKSSMASATPVVGPKGVYVLFATADLVALDRDSGAVLWYRSLTSDYPNIANQVGMASSPVLAGESLIVPMDTAVDSFAAALSVVDGRNLWKVDRPRDLNWVTPLVHAVNGKPQVIFPHKKDIVSYDAATGKKLWNFPASVSGTPSPVSSGENVIVPAGETVCLRPSVSGPPEVVWKSAKLGGGSCSPLVYEDRAYNVTGAGVVIVVDLKTGKELGSERLKGKFWASPIIVGGKLYAFNDSGVGFVVKLGDKPEVLATNDLGDEIMGTPAVADGALFVSTVDRLYCIAAK